MTKCCIVLIMCFCNASINAQEFLKVHAGFGFGLDYGGDLGVKITYLPAPQVGLFGSVGLYYYYTGFTLGAQVKFPSEKRLSGYVTVMYGCNGGWEIEETMITEQYYGPSIGGGIELNYERFPKLFWNFGLLIPFRDPRLQTDIAALEAQGLKVYSSTWPVNISIGLHGRLEWSDLKFRKPR